MWLLDPADVTISIGLESNEVRTGNVFTPTAGATSSNINSTALGAALGGVTGTDITITTTSTGNAAGNITVVDAITWTRVPGLGQLATTLTLNASGDVNINAAITATSGNLVVCCGRDITVARLLPFPATQTVTTTNGSVLFSAGRNITINGAMTTTDGNVAFCAGGDISINGAMTLTRGTQVGAESLASLGVLQGMSLSAGNAATGPGLAGGGGSVNIVPAGGTITITQGGGPTTAAPVTITYNPLSYTVPATDFTARFDAGTPITVRRLVFPGVVDQTQGTPPAATFTGLLKADLSGVTPVGVTLGGAGTGNFDRTDILGTRTVTFNGFALAGADAGLFALPGAAFCCAPVVQRTTGNIIAAVPAPPVAVPAPPAAATPPPVTLLSVESTQSPLIQHAVATALLVPAGLNLTVVDTGVRMPPVQLAQTPPVPNAPITVSEEIQPAAVPPETPSAVVPPVTPPPIYVPPRLPPRLDRN
jgi:hypothetical protein